MPSIWLVHLTSYDPATSTTRMLCFSSQGYTSGVSDLPPGGAEHTAYEPRIKQPAVMRRDCFDAGTTGGESRVGYGALELVNIDGGLDYLADLGIDGRPITLIFGTVERNGAAVWQTVLTGTVEQPAIGWSSVTLRLRDRQAELAKPLSPTTYSGSNTLPLGLEGVDDLKGKNKPKLFGRVFSISPLLVNTSKLIYQVNDGAIYSVDAVYDRGAALTKGADYASEQELLSTAPAAGAFRVWPAGGYFRLGSSPVGLVTADAAQGATTADRSAARIAAAIAATRIPESDISASDVAALDALKFAEVGIWIDDATNVNDALDKVAGSVGAWWGFDRLGQFRIARFDAPTGAPVAYLAAADIISIKRVASNDAGRGVPAWKVTINYKRYYTPQTSDLAGVVAADRRADIAKEYRTVESSDASIKARHLLASDLTHDTLLVNASVAQSEADRRLALFKAERATLDVRLGLDPSLLSTLDLGAVVRLTLPRFGMSTGRDFRVIGLQPDFRLGVIDVTLWG